MDNGWNDIADKLPGLAFRQKKLPRMDEAPQRIIIHHTGSGVLDRAKQWGIHPDAAAVRVYQQILEFSPHYVVGEKGIYQIVPETHKAWHAGLGSSRNSKLRYYASGKAREDYAWWAARWPGTENPRDLLPEGRGANAQIGIELVAVPKGEEFSDATYANLSTLLNNISYRLHIPRDKFHILGHSDVDPVARSTNAASWDPPRHLDWDRVVTA